MAKLGGAKGFWETIKSVSVAEIGREANRPLSIAVVGPQGLRAEATQALYDLVSMGAGRPEELVRARAMPEPPFIQGFDSTSQEDHFPTQAGIFDLVIDVGGRKEAPQGTPIYSISELGGWERTLDRILEDRPDLSLALARNFPVFRKRVAQDIIARTATTNAQFALITGVAEAIPITAIILPVSSLSDIVVLTKNQAMMVLRLAAAYGLPVDYKSRVKEIGPILANAFGWRAIARELVGAVPGVGFLARATIAYAGTAAVGKAAQVYYETGETVTAAQARKLYRDAYEASRSRVRALAESIRKGSGGGGGRRRRIAAANGNGADAADTPAEADHPAEEPAPTA